MNWKKSTRIILVSSIAALSLVGCQDKGSDTKVAIGKGFAITEQDFNKAMKSTHGNETIRNMILGNIYRLEVGKDRYKAVESDVDNQIKQIKDLMNGQEAFNQVLGQAGFSSEDAYRTQLINYSLQDEVIKKNIKVSDSELKKAYETYQPPVTASHILVDNEKTAKDIIKQLNEGADFAKLAKKYSKDSSSAKKGGSLGQVKKGDMVKEFEDALFKLDEGEYTKEPVKTKYGYHIIKMDKKPKKGTLDKEKDQLTKSIKQEKSQDSAVVSQVVRDLLKKYKVEIKDDDLGHAFDQFRPQEKKKNENKSKESSKETKKDNSKENSKAK